MVCCRGEPASQTSGSTSICSLQTLLDYTLTLVRCLANRGSVKDAEYFLRIASGVAGEMKSPIMVGRINSATAELQARLQEYEASFNTLGEVTEAITANEGIGPDVVEVQRIQGDIFSRQEMAAEAGQMFDGAVRGVQGFDAALAAAEALVPS